MPRHAIGHRPAVIILATVLAVGRVAGARANVTLSELTLTGFASAFAHLCAR